MIVADTSALVAILFDEPDSRTYLDAIDREGSVIVGAPSAFELRLVVERKLGPEYQPAADMLLAAPKIEIVAWTPALSHSPPTC